MPAPMSCDGSVPLTGSLVQDSSNQLASSGSLLTQQHVGLVGRAQEPATAMACRGGGKAQLHTLPDAHNVLLTSPVCQAVEPAQTVLLKLPWHRAAPSAKAQDFLVQGKKDKVTVLLGELRTRSFSVAYMAENPDASEEELGRCPSAACKAQLKSTLKISGVLQAQGVRRHAQGLQRPGVCQLAAAIHSTCRSTDELHAAGPHRPAQQLLQDVVGQLAGRGHLRACWRGHRAGHGDLTLL